MPNELKKKPKDTHVDPNRSPYQIWKFHGKTFEAPLRFVLLRNLYFQQGKPVFYALVDPTARRVTWTAEWKELEKKDRQSIYLPEWSYLAKIIVLPKDQPLPDLNGENESEEEEEALFDDDSEEGDEPDNDEKVYLLTVSTESPRETEFEIFIHGTGHTLYDPDVIHLGTLMFKGGKYVHHAFYRKDFEMDAETVETDDDDIV